MRTKFFKNLFPMTLGILLATSLTITAFSEPGAQGTEGDELQVAEAQQLEIQLGPEWSGVEFILKTDAGIYPNAIPVDENGILSLEIGGSKKYTLSCMESFVAIPELLMQAPVTNEAETEGIAQKENAGKENKNTISGIPVSHIVMFGVGIVLAIGILAALYIAGRNKPIVQDDEDEDDF